MRKKLAISFVVLALMCALAGGATFAWFTSTAPVGNNTFSTGTVDVDLTGVSVPVDVDNIAPGWTANYSGNIVNNGSLDAYFRIAVNDFQNPALNGAEGTLGDLINCVVKVNDVQVWSGTLSALAGVAYIDGDAIAAGASLPFSISLELPNSVGNEAQGLNLNADLTLQATQVANNPGRNF